MSETNLVASRGNTCHRSRLGGVFTFFLIILIIFGISRFRMSGGRGMGVMGFSPLIILSVFVVFILILIVIGAISMSANETNKLTNLQHMKLVQNQTQKQTQQYKPYAMQNTTQIQCEEPIYRQIKTKIPTDSEINYCRICGVKIERDAVFCHSCGTQL